MRPASTPGRRSYFSSRVSLTGVLVLYRGRHRGAPSKQGFLSVGIGSTAPGMLV
jgi:hypothetical protein